MISVNVTEPAIAWFKKADGELYFQRVVGWGIDEGGAVLALVGSKEGVRSARGFSNFVNVEFHTDDHRVVSMVPAVPGSFVVKSTEPGHAEDDQEGVVAWGVTAFGEVVPLILDEDAIMPPWWKYGIEAATP